LVHVYDKRNSRNFAKKRKIFYAIKKAEDVNIKYCIKGEIGLKDENSGETQENNRSTSKNYSI
jgi:hypothetical protein